MKQKITMLLNFDGAAEEAVDVYTSVFANSRVTSKRYHAPPAPDRRGR